MKELDSLVAIAQLCEGHDRPKRGMRVLTAVFAHAGYIAFDVSGITLASIEWRREQQDDLSVAPDEVAADGVHRTLGAISRRGLREHRPRLRDRVDLAFITLCRPERPAVIEIGAPIPLAVPGQLEGASQAAGFSAVALRELRFLSKVGNRRELVQHVMKEPAEPDALAAAFRADAVHPVVPITTANQRQPVNAGREAAIDRAHAMLEKGRRLARSHWRPIGLDLSGRKRRGLEERHALIQDAGITGHADIM